MYIWSIKVLRERQFSNIILKFVNKIYIVTHGIDGSINLPASRHSLLERKRVSRISDKGDDASPFLVIKLLSFISEDQKLIQSINEKVKQIK